MYPYERTKIYELCAEQNLLTNEVVVDFVEGTVLKFSWLDKNRMLFLRNYFRPVMKLYKKIYTNNPAKVKRIEQFTDYLLSSPVIAVLIYAPSNFVFKTVRKSKLLAKIVGIIKVSHKKRKMKQHM